MGQSTQVLTGPQKYKPPLVVGLLPPALAPLVRKTVLALLYGLLSQGLENDLPQVPELGRGLNPMDLTPEWLLSSETMLPPSCCHWACQDVPPCL